VTKNKETKERGGSLFDFAYSAFSSPEFVIELTYQEISEKSMSKYNSTFSQCVHDVAIGELDLCIGPFWITSERALQTPFTNSLFNDEFFLVVPTQKENKSFFDLLATPFLPFENDAWFLIIAATIYMAWVVRFIQKFTRNHTTRQQKEVFTLRSIGFAFYDGINSMTSGGVTNVSEKPSIPEKLVVSGFAIFALLVLTAYTATSAASLVVKEHPHGLYSDLDQVAKAGKNVCIRQVLAGTFMGKDKRFTIDGKNGTSKVIEINESDAMMFEEVNNGTCVGVIIDADGFERLQTGVEDDGIDYCEFIRVGDVVFTMVNAFPVSPEFHYDISYIIQDSLNDGELMRLNKVAQDQYLGPNNCTDTMIESSVGIIGGGRKGKNGGGGSDDVIIFGTEELMAALLFTFFMTTLGLVLCLSSVCQKSKKKGLEHDENVANDSKFDEGEVREEE